MPGNLVNLTPEVIAQWPKSNFVDPYQRLWVTPVLAMMYGVASTVIALRLWVRFRKHGGGLGYDDILISLGWLCSTGYTVSGICSVELKKSNRHMWDIPVPNWEGIALFTAIAELLYLMAGGFIRVSVLLFYRRLTDETCSRRWRYSILTAIWFTVCWVTTMNLVLTFSCSPVSAYWQSFNPDYTGEYKCINVAAINYIVGTLTIVGDLYSIAMPCIMTWNFTMPRAQKIGLNIVFGLGLFVIVACIIRNYYLFRLNKDPDFSWLLTNVYVLCQLEIQLAFICASAPALRILFRQYLKPPMTKMLRSSVSNDSQDLSRTQDSATEKQCWGDFYSALAGRWSVSGPGGQEPSHDVEKSGSDVREEQLICSFEEILQEHSNLSRAWANSPRIEEEKKAVSNPRRNHSPV